MDMYVENIPFEQNMPIAFDAYKVSHYHLHCHEGVIEVLIILSGSAHVKVSFEQFDMTEGDYILVNYGDSHSIYATDSKCQVASLYFNLNYYKEHIPYLDYVLFACESFDLVKYKNETQTLRKMIANVILNLAKDQVSFPNKITQENLLKSAEELLWSFVNDYDMKNYYNRNWNAGYSKTEKYYKIMKYIYENYDAKNLMDLISKNEFYSKSYITHLFKQVGASSFQDVLTYIRLYKSEKLLLDSEVPIIEIADRCGFSDIKYYTSNFKKWFLQTPSEYRKTYQPEIHKSSLFQRLRVEELIGEMESLIKSNTYNTPYKAAVNPLSIKTKDTWVQLFEGSDMEQIIYEMNQKKISRISAEETPVHLICININDKSDLRDLVSKFSFFRNEGFTPTLIINYKEVSLNQCNELIIQCSHIFCADDQINSDIEIIIAYSNLGDKSNINRILSFCRKLKKIKLMPMLMA